METYVVYKNGIKVGEMEYPATGEFDANRNKTIDRLEADGYEVVDVTPEHHLYHTACGFCGRLIAIYPGDPCYCGECMMV